MKNYQKTILLLLLIMVTLVGWGNTTVFGQTSSQSNAVQTAELYLSVLPLSRSGLIYLLMAEGFSTTDATYGADNCGADWNKQAVRAAENYLSIFNFSYNRLIFQLVFDGFTIEQAVYAAKQSGLTP